MISIACLLLFSVPLCLCGRFLLQGRDKRISEGQFFVRKYRAEVEQEAIVFDARNHGCTAIRPAQTIFKL